MAVLTSTGIKFAVGDELTSRRQIFPTSTAWIFYNSSAPTGWTKVTTHDNKSLRVVSGSGGGFGGTNSFTTTMSSFDIGGALSSSDSTGGTQLLTTQIATHNHPSNGVALAANPATYNPDGAFTGYSGGDVSRAAGWSQNSPATGSIGFGNSHAHPFSGSGTVPNQPVSISVQYLDIIVCTFDG
jgi:hypothetical protein